MILSMYSMFELAEYRALERAALEAEDYNFQTKTAEVERRFSMTKTPGSTKRNQLSSSFRFHHLSTMY